MVLYRVVREALQNIIRHSKATRVTVGLVAEDAAFVLNVRDDGRGFDAPERLIDLVRNGHFGLAGASERLEEVGGTLGVVSAPEDGTRVTARVPRGAGS